MISVDSNIILRLILDDDPLQSGRAKKMVQKHSESDGVYIPTAVLLEVTWFLKIKKVDIEMIYRIVHNLLNSEGLVFDEKTLLVAALERFKKLKGKVGFADCLILESSIKNRCKLFTFDKELLKSDTLNCFD